MLRGGFVGLIFFFGLAGLAVGQKAESKPSESKPAEPQEQSAPAETPEHLAIRKAAADVIAAANARDLGKLVASFTEDAEIFDDEGGIHRGRAKIKETFAAFIKDFPDAVTTLDVQAVQIVCSDVGVVQALKSTECKAGRAKAGHQTTLVFRKTEGKWQVASVREFADDPDPTPADKLKDMEWLVGDWVDESPDVEVDASVQWDEGRNFIIGKYTIKRKGQKLLVTDQRIGWDPVQQKIRSWFFTTDGGFGEGVWTRSGDRWVVKITGTSGDGQSNSATFTYTMMSKDRYQWRATDRVVGDDVDEDREVVIVRKAPKPGSKNGATNR